MGNVVKVPITIGKDLFGWTVNAPRLKINKNNKNLMFGLLEYTNVPKELKGRTFLDYTTGLIYVVDNSGNIIGSTMSTEAALLGRFLHYYGRLQSEADRQAVITNALDLINLASARIGNPTLTTELFTTNIRNARAKAANLVNGVVNTPNHLLLGPARVAISPTYNLNDYFNGLYNADISQQTIGLGDMLEVQNPLLNFLLNIANPTSAVLTKLITPGRVTSLKVGSTNYSFRVPNSSTFKSGIKSKVVKSNSIRLADNQGYGFPNHRINTFNNYPGGSSSVTFSVPNYIYNYQPAKYNYTPTMYYRSNINPVPQSIPVVIDLGHVESFPISPWQQEWVNTGKMPESKAKKWNNSKREGLYNTNETYWLLGNGKRFNSNLSNTTNYGQGYKVLR